MKQRTLAAVASGALCALALTASANAPTDVPDRAEKAASAKCPSSCASCSNPITVNCAPSSELRTEKVSKPAANVTGSEATDRSEDQIKPWWLLLLNWIVDLFKALGSIAWPALFVFAILYLGRDLIKTLLGNVRRVKSGGFEVEFNADRAREVKAIFRQSYENFLRAAKSEYDRQVSALRLQDTLLLSAAEVIRERVRAPDDRSLRVTVHVQDVVFKGYLYQLLDYYPGGGGKGRRCSERYGILGRTWRLRQSLGQGNALYAGPHLTSAPIGDAEYALITEWGMTHTEAVAAISQRARESYLCVLLIPSHATTGIPEGVLYADAVPLNAFGDTRAAIDLAASLENDPAVKALADAVEKVMQELRKGATSLEFAVAQ